MYTLQNKKNLDNTRFESLRMAGTIINMVNARKLCARNAIIDNVDVDTACMYKRTRL